MSDEDKLCIEIHIDPNALNVQAAARALLDGLIEQRGLGTAAGIATVLFAAILIEILHTETPYPELSREAVRGLIDGVRQVVTSHETCDHGTDDASKPTVH